METFFEDDCGGFTCNMVACWSLRSATDPRKKFVNDWRLPRPEFWAVVDDFGNLVRVPS